MNSEKIKSHVPRVYQGCVEIDEISRVEDELLDMFEEFSVLASVNQFILTSTSECIEQREKSLNIVTNPITVRQGWVAPGQYQETEEPDIEFRRQRLLSRYAMTPPFTLRLLKQKLDEIIGPGQWLTLVDYNRNILYIETAAFNQNWYEELEFTINYMKPCNLVFTSKPLISLSLAMSESISYQVVAWNYRMSRWRLREKPFSSRGDEVIIKMVGTPSITAQLLHDIAQSVNTNVASVLINNTIPLTTFSLRQVTESSLILEYAINPGMTNLITNIKLLKHNAAILTESSVYVPVTQMVLAKHTLTIREG